MMRSIENLLQNFAQNLLKNLKKLFFLKKTKKKFFSKIFSEFEDIGKDYFILRIPQVFLVSNVLKDNFQWSEHARFFF